jgi:hypothetical protein
MTVLLPLLGLLAVAVLTLGTAVAVGSDSERYPPAWLFHRRWNARPGVTVRGDAIRRETIAGRTAAWVPAVQR